MNKLLLLAFMTAWQVDVPVSPSLRLPADRLPADVTVRAILERPDHSRLALVELADGTRRSLKVGDELGAGKVTEIRLEDATLIVRERILDMRHVDPWRNYRLPQSSILPLDIAIIGVGTPCPRVLLKVEGGVAVFTSRVPKADASFLRVAKGEELCSGWRIESLSMVGGVDPRGAIVLVHAATRQRLALRALRP